MGVLVLSGCGSAGSGTPIGDVICRGSGVVVGGRVTFVKRLYNNQGLTGERVIKPVRYAQVDIVLDVDGRALLSTYTDADGYYCTEVRGVPPDFPFVYPRVASKTDPKRLKINVIDRLENLPNANLYSRAGAAFDATIPGNYDVDIHIPVTALVGANAEFPLAGAFNILDVATTGTETAIALTGRPPTAELFIAWTPGTVFGSGTFGTYFTGSDPLKRAAGIELSGGIGGGPDEGNHDEFDDDVILHEYGHFMAYSFSKPAEVGGTHYLNDNTQDIRLAWSEGWATFFSAATRNKPDMVNTYGGDPGSRNHEFSYSFNIETPSAKVLDAIGTPLERYGTYTTSEVAVASVLWDLYDSQNEPGDRFSLGLRAVWDVFSRLATAPNNVSLETFAGIFGPLYGSTNLAQTANLRLVQLFEDQYDTRVPDDDRYGSHVPVAVPGSPTCHTLYPIGDIDHMRFTLTSPSAVTIETFNLSNGADTVLELLDATGQVLLRNDNVDPPRSNVFQPTGCGNRRDPIPQNYYDLGINNGSRLASTISTTKDRPDAPLLQAGDYYLRIMSRATFDQLFPDPNRPRRNFAAGELGSYDVILTLQ